MPEAFGKHRGGETPVWFLLPGDGRDFSGAGEDAERPAGSSPGLPEQTAPLLRQVDLKHPRLSHIHPGHKK